MKFIKLSKKISIIFIITTIFLNSSFFVIPAQAQKTINLKDYLTHFYNRYSRHFDEHGMVFKTPGYGITEFKKPQTAREILSLAAYYKFRALKGKIKTRKIIRQAILDAQQEMNSRNYNTQSFSDAWAQLAMISLSDQIPFLLTPEEQHKVYQDIINRIEAGIQAPDTSNRAALSAVYWQYIINNLYQKKLITIDSKKEFDILIYHKIKQVLINDINQQYWYLEGQPKQFNPHYHLITAVAFASYAEITGDIEFSSAAKKMVKNLRQLAFSNGMIEAHIGKRPVGLGAQFYLGLGLLSYKFGFANYSVFLNYAYGDRFFSDPAYPHRLEYHTTIKSMAPNYHDDISFSNLAELIWLAPSFKHIIINLKPNDFIKSNEVVYYKNLKIEQVDADHAILNFQQSASNSQLPTANSQQLIQPILKLNQFYNSPRLDIVTENQHIKKFLSQISLYNLTPQTKKTLASAYLYGGYTLPEILDTIFHGPRAVHPTIPAIAWHHSDNYQKYSEQKQSLINLINKKIKL